MMRECVKRQNKETCFQTFAQITTKTFAKKGKQRRKITHVIKVRRRSEFPTFILCSQYSLNRILKALSTISRNFGFGNKITKTSVFA